MYKKSMQTFELELACTGVRMCVTGRCMALGLLVADRLSIEEPELLNVQTAIL